MRDLLFRFAWRHFRDQLLAMSGLKNNTIRFDTEFLDLYGEIKLERTAVMGFRDMYNVYSLMKRVIPTVDGDIAELGVYRGGSAKIICRLKGERPLHLFDTFAGMPSVNIQIDLHRQGDFADTSLDQVRSYLPFPNVFFYPGIFPESAQELANRDVKFCFVHLDVDIYSSTLAGLRFFWPRVNPGGVLLIHDYRSISCPGVRKAVDYFFRDSPHAIVELWESYCLVVKPVSLMS